MEDFLASIVVVSDQDHDAEDEECDTDHAEQDSEPAASRHVNKLIEPDLVERIVVTFLQLWEQSVPQADVERMRREK